MSMLTNVMLFIISIVLVAILLVAFSIAGLVRHLYTGISNVRKDIIALQCEMIKQTAHASISKVNLEALNKKVADICRDYYIKSY
jgi:hypothetical protein